MFGRFGSTGLVLAAMGLALVGSGCNDSKLAAAPVATPTPPADQPPIADIQGATTWAPLATATFDGSGSHDPDGTITAYAWEITARPNGSVSAVTPTGTNGDQASFFVDLAGSYTIKLTVTDNSGNTGSAELTFNVVPSQDLHVELEWPSQYTKVDMDLHLLNETAGGSASSLMWDTVKDCHWENCKPAFGEVLDWGATGVTADNPRLDIDNIAESVPENINIDTPANGKYHVCVHYWASHMSTDIPVDLIVTVYLGGSVAWTGTITLTTTNQVWDVGYVTWSNGAGTFTPSPANTIFMTTYI
ncbi:MAG TPA: PKD domain-containing protein [bacterium]|nr:PKD domain-containing protein [bacterium]